MSVKPAQPRRGRRVARAIAWTCLAVLVFGLAPGITPVRHLLSAPLIATKAHAIFRVRLLTGKAGAIRSP